MTQSQQPDATALQPITVYVCTSCKVETDALEPREAREGARLHASLVAAAAARSEGPEITIVPVDCLSVCKRPVTVSFAAPGKWTYIYGDMPAGTSAEVILESVAKYAVAPDGLIPWKERPPALKKGVIARLPPVRLAAAE